MSDNTPVEETSHNKFCTNCKMENYKLDYNLHDVQKDELIHHFVDDKGNMKEKRCMNYKSKAANESNYNPVVFESAETTKAEDAQ